MNCCSSFFSTLRASFSVCVESVRPGVWSGLLALVVVSMAGATAPNRMRLDTAWRFHLGDAPGAAQTGWADAGWSTVTVPHDWSIGLPITADAPAGGDGGFFPTGLGWYRRDLEVPADWTGRRVVIEFEGVYRKAEVWLNGHPVGGRSYGYNPFRCDLTPFLKPGAKNVLAVKVDNSAQPNSRWYTGSGIYRPVWLEVMDPVHVVRDSVFVTTPQVTARRATVRVEAAVRNETAVACDVQVDVRLRDAAGRSIGAARVKGTVAAGAEFVLNPELIVRRPALWSPESPALYRAEITVSRDGQPGDTSDTAFGVRTLSYTAARGFELNGQVVKLLGGNVHHDNGILGAVADDRAEERKVELLKEAGFNAARTSHNPPSRAFLEACDRLGLLGLDEAFDGWRMPKRVHDYGEDFDEWWARDIETWVRRDRNHPSVVMWSTGNEMFERTSESGRRIARELAAKIRELDPTRPVTAGVNGAGKNREWTELDPLFAAFEVAGYNYELTRQAVDHVRLPQRIMFASESYQSEAFANWAIMRDQPYVIGDFVWTALDYLGEAGIGRVFPPDEEAKKHWEADMYPWHAAYCGDIDLTGWRKPASHYRKIVWDGGEKLYAAVAVPPPGGKPWNVTPWSLPPLLPTWSWAGHEGESLTVEVYSRYDDVLLFLNDELVGEKPTGVAQEFKAVFHVPYAPGELRVVGRRAGVGHEEFVLESAGRAEAIRLTADRTHVRADGRDLAFVTVEAIDAAGRWQPHAAPRLTFAVEGPARLMAVGSGDPTAMESYVGSDVILYQGRALAVVRADPAGGAITVTASSPGLPDAVLTLTSAQP